MAFFTDMDDGRIKVIASKDAAIEGTAKPEYDEYLETLDESKLSFVEGGKPTRFVMRKIIPYKQSLKLKNQQVAMRDGVLQPQVSYVNEEVRMALIDIENPEVPKEYEKHLLVFRKESDGGASQGVMEKLEAFEVIPDLFQARQNHAPKSSISDIDKKKS